MKEKIDEIYSGLKERCYAIKDGRFIMSNNKIAQLLRYIASYDETISFLTECNKLYDYKQEFYAATSVIGTSKVFNLPDNKYKIVALVTGLLYDIDRGTIEILNFLKEYFDKGDVDKSFEAFYNEVIVPYSKAYEYMVFNKPVELDDISEEKSKKLSESICEQLYPYLVSLSGIVMGDTNISSVRRCELLDMLEGMCYAIETANIRLLKYMWIGLKNTFSQYKIAGSLLTSIRSILITFAIIK